MKFKKILAAALSASMLLGMTNIADLQPNIQIPTVTATAADTVDSGTCGPHSTWTLDSESTLTIRGVGEITSPTFQQYKNIKNVIIENGITFICDSAFIGCSDLETITIPDSVTYIGNNAFQGCESLKSIVIPDSVQSIEQGTFYVSNTRIGNAENKQGHYRLQR